MKILLDKLSGCSEKQIAKINTIVNTMYNRLSQAEVQSKLPKPLVSRAIKGYDTDMMTIIKDKYFNGSTVITAILNVSSFKDGEIYNLATLINTPLNNIIIGNGSDDKDHPNTFLSNYGAFKLDGNDIIFECILKPAKQKYYIELRAT